MNPFWTGPEFYYHPSDFHDWRFQHPSGDLAHPNSRLYNQNFGAPPAMNIPVEVHDDSNDASKHQDRKESTGSNHRRFSLPTQWLHPSKMHLPHPHLPHPHMPHWHAPHIHFPFRYLMDMESMVDPFYDAGNGTPGSDPRKDGEKTDENGNKEDSENGVPVAEKKLKRCELPPENRGMSEISHGKDFFRVKLDVPQFTPDEMKVRVIQDYVVIDCQHEERPDAHGLITRSFTRKYVLPKDVDPKTVESILSPDGTLQIQAQWKKPENQPDRHIDIDLSGQLLPKKIES